MAKKFGNLLLAFLISVILLVGLAAIYLGPSVFATLRFEGMSEQEQIREAEKLLDQIHQICSGHPVNCPQGEVFAWAHGMHLDVFSHEGVTILKRELTKGIEWNSGFEIHSPETGRNLVYVEYPPCDIPGADCSHLGIWVKGYKPVTDGEHVRDDFYVLDDKGIQYSLDHITKLPDITITVTPTP